MPGAGSQILGPCARTRKRPLGAQGGALLTASKETRPQEHGKEFLHRKGSTHSEYNSCQHLHPTVIGLLQKYKIIRFFLFQVMNIVMLCYKSNRKLIQRRNEDVIKGPEKVTSSIPWKKSGDTINHTSEFYIRDQRAGY